MEWDNGEVSTAKGLFCAWWGSFPYILPRLDQGWKVWPHLRLTTHPPSYYAKKFYFDSLNYDPINLKYMIERFGHEKFSWVQIIRFIARSGPGKGD